MNKKLERILNKSNYELDSLGTDEKDSVLIDDAVDIVRRALEDANKLILEYRPITKLTNAEITEACVKFFDIKEDEIMGIKRVEEPIQQVNIKLVLENLDGSEEEIWTCIRDPFNIPPACIYDEKKRHQYFQWCLAHGVCLWLKDHPYLEGN